MKDMWLWYTTGEYSDSSHLIDVKKGRERLCDRFQLLPSPAVIPEDICAKTKHRRTAPLTQNRPHNTLGPTPLRLCVCVPCFSHESWSTPLPSPPSIIQEKLAWPTLPSSYTTCPWGTFFLKGFRMDATTTTTSMTSHHVPDLIHWNA